MPSKMQSMGVKRDELPMPRARELFIVGLDGPADETHPLYDPNRVANLASEELQASIRQHKVLQNLVGRFAPHPTQAGVEVIEVVAGARRAYNARLVDPEMRVPVIVKTLTDVDAIRLKQTENASRRDDAPIDKARRAERAMRVFGIAIEDVAADNEVTVRAVQRWLNALKAAPDVVAAWERGEIAVKAAASLAAHPPDVQASLLAQARQGNGHASATTVATAARVYSVGQPVIVSADEPAEPGSQAPAADGAKPKRAPKARAKAKAKGPTLGEVRRMIAFIDGGGKRHVARAVIDTLQWLAGDIPDSYIAGIAELRKAAGKPAAKP